MKLATIFSLGSFLSVVCSSAMANERTFSPPSSSCSYVAVEGDATYCVDSAPCYGIFRPQAPYTGCPRKGDRAVADCTVNSASFDAQVGACIAPRDAHCVQLSQTAWGCRFLPNEAGVFESSLHTPRPSGADEHTATLNPHAHGHPHLHPSESPATTGHVGVKEHHVNTSSNGHHSDAVPPSILVGGVIAVIAVVVVLLAKVKAQRKEQDDIPSQQYESDIATPV